MCFLSYCKRSGEAPFFRQSDVDLMMCCRLMPCKNGKNVYIYKNTKLAEGTVADVSAQMFENVVYSDLK